MSATASRLSAQLRDRPVLLEVHTRAGVARLTGQVDSLFLDEGQARVGLCVTLDPSPAGPGGVTRVYVADPFAQLGPADGRLRRVGRAILDRRWLVVREPDEFVCPHCNRVGRGNHCSGCGARLRISVRAACSGGCVTTAEGDYCERCGAPRVADAGEDLGRFRALG